jgi:hypothetical protein
MMPSKPKTKVGPRISLTNQIGTKQSQGVSGLIVHGSNQKDTVGSKLQKNTITLDQI